MTKIAIVCFEGVTDIDAFLHWDMLNRPTTMFALQPQKWIVHFLGTAASHETQSGIQLKMHDLIDQAHQYDVVLHTSGAKTRLLMRDKDYLERLGLANSLQIVGAQCSGSLILAASGCFSGLTATTYPSAMEELRSFGVEAVQEPFVPHERVASAAGCLAGIKLDEWIMSRYLDSELVSACINSAKSWGEGLEKLTNDT